jgi:hypothetical protein
MDKFKQLAMTTSIITVLSQINDLVLEMLRVLDITEDELKETFKKIKNFQIEFMGVLSLEVKDFLRKDGNEKFVNEMFEDTERLMLKILTKAREEEKNTENNQKNKYN